RTARRGIGELARIIAGARINDSRIEVAEIPGSLRRCQYGQDPRILPQTSPRPLIRGKEKHLVLLDRHADGSAEHVVFKNRSLPQEKIGGIQNGIAKIIE